ncbi:MAG: M67 family metallopeptidase, partial [Terriglobia bacterium]
PGRAEQLLPLSDAGRESERNRFLIDPQELRKLESEAKRDGLEVIGYYHSHPDHPARPSEYDRAHAFPWYSYAIIAVEGGKPGMFASWVLEEDRSRFVEEAIQVTSAPLKAV